MSWCGIYLIVAVVVASGTFVGADWLRADGVAAPDYPGVMSALAGMLWPVLLVGASQLALVWWASRTARDAPLQLPSFA